jgi:hypothetical protein
MRKTLPIGTYGYDNEQASSRKLVNCTAEQGPADGNNPIIVRRMPGIDSFATAGTKNRGAHVFKDELYTVSGTSLYKTDANGVVTTIGALPGTGRVRIADNGVTMVIVTNPLAYSTTGTTVSQIIDGVFTGFGGASDVAFLDGYLIFTVPNSRVTFTSGLNALTFNALDFTSIEGSTDNLLGVIVDHRQAIFLKEKSTELWYNAGIATGYPLARSPNGFLEVGCAARDTVAKLGGAVYWLADDLTVRQLSSDSYRHSPVIITNTGVAKFIRNGINPLGFAYTFEDKHYYTLTFDSVTIEYDILAKEWHNRSTFARSNWQVLTTIEVYGDILALDSNSGKIGKLSNLVRTEFGGTQKVSWTYQEIASEGRRIVHNRFELEIGTGVGLTTGEGSDPQIALWISDDGGKQFYEFDMRSLGKRGEYLDRVYWTDLGSSYNRVYRCEVSDAVDVLAFNTSIEVVGGLF